MCAGGALCGFSSFGLVVCALCSLALFGFRSLVGVSSCLFLFFSLVLLYVGVVNALIKGEIEDHVWFKDR
jgi:hypothetical protein